MLTRILYTDIWLDQFFIGLTRDEKLLFIYFLTNERVNIIHLYQCPDRRIVADTGIDTPIIKKAKEKFEKARKMFFKDGFIFLKNAHRYEKYEGPKNETAKSKLFSRLSKSILDWYNKLSDTPIDRGIDTLHKSEIINHKSEIINQRSKGMQSLRKILEERKR